ncbi:MAG TPA: response regulator [Pyrinomonadaceae bacterium]|nr:response regulator [Pyrinomonadaceae bacterium]
MIYRKSSSTRTVPEAKLGSIREKHLRILFIDDEDRFRRGMSLNLEEKYGAGVVPVRSGREAVQTLKAGNSFDIIFLDIMMPDVSGVETYNMMREVDPKCRIVMMSAYSDTEEWEKARQMHVELIEKPISEEVLSKILESVVSKA